MATNRSTRSTSPHSPKIVALATVELQMTQFFDEWHFRILKTSLGKDWTRRQSITTALELFAINGVRLPLADIAWLLRQPEDAMIQDICRRLTPDQRERFDDLVQTLQVLLVTVARVRNAVDGGDEDTLAEVMGDSEDGAIKDAIMKEAVVVGGREVSKLYQCQDTWVKNVEYKLGRLTHSSENAAQATQQLLRVEAQLEGNEVKSKLKLKRALAGFLASSEATLLCSCFSQWASLTVTNTAERRLRTSLEKELSEKEEQYFKTKERSMANIKNALGRAVQSSDSAVMGIAFGVWKEEVGGAQREREEAETLQQLQAKMEQFDAEHIAAAKKVFVRICQSNDDALVTSVFYAFAQAAKEGGASRKHLVEVEAKKAQFEEYMKTRKNSVRAQLERGLIMNDAAHQRIVLEKWHTYVAENREHRSAERELEISDTLLSSLHRRQKCSATGLQSRSTDQGQFNLLMRVMSHWELEAKTSRVEKYLQQKLNSKRKQLESVRVLFKNFAEKLEEGLSVCEDETYHSQRNARKERRGLSGSVSLPDIHQRPAH